MKNNTQGESPTPDDTPTPPRKPRYSRNWDKKLTRNITDRDVEEFFKQQTGSPMFNKADEYPAMTAAQLEGREHTDQVRRARLTQGESTMPVAPGAGEDGTWSPFKTVLPGFNESQVNYYVERMKLKPVQEVILRMRLMGWNLREISRYIEWKSGRPFGFQNVKHTLHGMRENVIDVFLDPDEDDYGKFGVFGLEVNRSIRMPKSPYLHESKCDCATFEQIPIESERTMRVPLNQTDSDGRELTHPVSFTVTAYLCAHCRKRRTQEQYDKLMAGQEF